MPGPQHRLPVDVTTESGQPAATATCFFAAFTDDNGAERWRGFLTFIDPAGALAPGGYRLRLPDGGSAAIQVREIRTDQREQAVFVGVGSPPPIPDQAPE